MNATSPYSYSKNWPGEHRTNGNGTLLIDADSSKNPSLPSSRYNPDTNIIDPAFDTSMVVALTLASVVVVSGITVATITLPILIARRVQRRRHRK